MFITAWKLYIHYKVYVYTHICMLGYMCPSIYLYLGKNQCAYNRIYYFGGREAKLLTYLALQRMAYIGQNTILKMLKAEIKSLLCNFSLLYMENIN